MRNILLALAAIGFISLSTSVIADEGAAQSVLQDTAEAIAPVAQPEALPAGEQVASASDATAAPEQVAHTHNHYRRPAKKQNVLQRLVELEKRKNAWLRRTFFGR